MGFYKNIKTSKEGDFVEINGEYAIYENGCWRGCEEKIINAQKAAYVILRSGSGDPVIYKSFWVQSDKDKSWSIKTLKWSKTPNEMYPEFNTTELRKYIYHMMITEHANFDTYIQLYDNYEYLQR